MTETQKEKNQKYILDNLDKYVFDNRGNFVNIDSDTYGTEYFFIGREGVASIEEIVDKMVSMVLQNKEDWKVILEGRDGHKIKNRKDERVIYEVGFGLEKGYIVIGELGYRKGAWKNYEEYKNWQEDYKKQMEEDEKIRKQLEEEKRKRLEEEQKKRNQNQNPTLQSKNNSSQTSPVNNCQSNENKDSSENKELKPIENNDNQSPTNQTPNQPNNKNNNKETQTKAKNQINQLIKSNSLKTSDLPEKYQNWEKELEKLDSKEKIEQFAKELEQEIKKKANIKNKNNQSNSKKDNNKHDFKTILIVCSLITLAMGLLIWVAIVIRKTIILRSRKNRKGKKIK